MNLVVVGEVFNPALCVDASSISYETDFQFLLSFSVVLSCTMG
jgi:hypothetical protein